MYYLLEKYKYMNEEELDTVSIEAKITMNQKVVINPKDYVEKDGIRYFTRPLKVPAYVWAFAIPGLLSMVYLADDTETLYVFAVAATVEDNDKLAEIYRKDPIDSIYRTMWGYTAEEVNCID